MVSNKDIKEILKERREGKITPKSEKVTEPYLNKCPDCGAENTAENRFCFNCGCSLEEKELPPENSGYIVCDRCNDVYKLQENENPDDYKTCQCGGKFTFVLDIDDIESETKKCELCNFDNPYLAENCYKCGKKFQDYLLYIETKRQDIGICEDKIVVYNKLDNKKLQKTLEYDLDKIVNLRFIKGFYKYDIEFDYDKNHIKLPVTEKQGNYAKSFFTEWKSPVVTCPNIDCISVEYIKEGEICTNCGVKGKKYPYESLKSLHMEKQLKKQERIRSEREKVEQEKKERIRRENEKIQKERIKYGFLKEAIGVNGKIELFPHKIRIKKGFTALKDAKTKSDKEILLNQISSIKFSNASKNKTGFIKFAFSGGDESKKGLFQASHEENVLNFNQQQQMAFKQIKEMIEAQMIIQHNPITDKKEKTNFYEIEKLAELREKGIISEKEFEAKKRQILGL